MATTTMIPLGQIKQGGRDQWIDCSIGGLLCPSCGGYVGQLDVFGDEAVCESCGNRFRLVVTVEMREG